MRLVIGNTNLGMIVDRDSQYLAGDNLMSLVISRPPKIERSTSPVPIDCEEAVDDTEREIAREIATATATAALSAEAESSAAHIHINTRGPVKVSTTVDRILCVTDLVNADSFSLTILLISQTFEHIYIHLLQLISMRIFLVSSKRCMMF